MKAAPQALIDYLQTNDQQLFADLYQVTLLDGSSYHYAAGDLSLVVDGQTYRADQLRVDGLAYKIAVGLDTDQQTVTLSYSPTDLVAGLPWGWALRLGVLDGAYIRRSRAFYTAFNQPPVGVVPLFNGKISTATTVGRTEAQVSVKSMMLLLDTLMPCNTYQTGCLHTLFDAGCGLARANYQMSWMVAAGPTNVTIPVPSQIPPLPAALAGNPEGLGIFVQGTILFTSGTNEGIYRTIKGVSSKVETGLDLVYPLETAPAEGDTFHIWPGCDKTQATCTSRFNNLANLRAFPFTPSPEVAF